MSRFADLVEPEPQAGRFADLVEQEPPAGRFADLAEAAAPEPPAGRFADLVEQEPQEPPTGRFADLAAGSNKARPSTALGDPTLLAPRGRRTVDPDSRLSPVARAIKRQAPERFKALKAQGPRGFWGGLAQDPEYAIPILGPVAQSVDLGGVYLAMKRLAANKYEPKPEYETRYIHSQLGQGPQFPYQKGMKSPEEQKAYDQSLVDKFIERKADEEIRGYTTAGHIGKGVQAIPDFMVSFMLTGPGKMMVEKGVQKYLFKKLKHKVGKKIGREITGELLGPALKTTGLGRKALKTLTSGTSWVAGGTTRALQLPWYTALNTFERAIGNLQVTDKGKLALGGGEKIGSAVLHGFLENVAEMMGEVTGETIAKPFGKVLSKVRKTFSKSERKLANSSMALFKKTHPEKTIDKLFTKGGYSSFIGELGEESVTELLNVAFGTSSLEDFAKSHSGQQMMIKAGVLSVPGAARVGLRAVTTPRGADQADLVEPADLWEPTEEELEDDRLYMESLSREPVEQVEPEAIPQVEPAGRPGPTVEEPSAVQEEIPVREPAGPEAQEPSATAPARPLEKAGTPQQEASRLGIIYNGPQKGVGGELVYETFTDSMTKTTFGVKPSQSVETKLAEARARMAQKPQPTEKGPELPTVPERPGTQEPGTQLGQLGQVGPTIEEPPASIPSEVEKKATEAEISPAVSEHGLLMRTSARKVDMNRDRVPLGLDIPNSPKRREWKTVLEQAQAQGLPDNAHRLAAEIHDKPRPLSDIETAGLVVKLTQLKNEHEDLTEKIDRNRKSTVRALRKQIKEHDYYQTVLENQEFEPTLNLRQFQYGKQESGEVKSFLQGRFYLRRYLTTQKSDKAQPWDEAFQIYRESNPSVTGTDINSFLEEIERAFRKKSKDKYGLSRTATAIARQNPDFNLLVEYLESLEQGGEVDAEILAMEIFDTAEMRFLDAERRRVEQEFDFISEAKDKSGTEEGRALAAHKLTINRDYKLISIKNMAKAAKGPGKKLTKAQEENFERLANQLKKGETRMAELEQRVNDLTALRTVRVSGSRRRSRMSGQQLDVEKQQLTSKLDMLLKAGCNN